MINNDILEELWTIKDKLSEEASNNLYDYCKKINTAAKKEGFTLVKSISSGKNTLAVAEETTDYRTVNKSLND